MISPVSPEILGVLNKFLTIFSPVKYKSLSIPRILIYDFVKYILTTPAKIENLLSSNAVYPIELIKLQNILNPDYPEPVFSKGKVLLDGWMQENIPDSMKQLCLKAPFTQKTNVARNEILKVHDVLNQLLKTIPTDLPLFSEPSFQTWMKQHITPTVIAIEGIINQIAAIQPSCIALLGNQYFLHYRIVGEYAKVFRIPSLAYAPNTLLNTDDCAAGFLTIPLITYFYTPWGREHKDWLLRFGAPPQRIIPIGCARFDRYPVQSGLKNEDIRNIMGFNGMDYLILGDQQVKEKEAVFRMIWEAIKDDPSLGIIVKLHPHYEQFITDYQKWCDHSSRVKFIPPLSLSLEDILNARPLALVTYFSTVGVEAAYYQIPVLTPVIEGPKPPYLFHPSGGSIPVKSAFEAAEAINKLRVDKLYHDKILERQKEYLNYVSVPDGKAAKRFFDLLNMMAEGTKPLFNQDL
ncbi:MAG TPA: hypothetical protein VHY08_07470 [Bacillota bacterium]|nr:hypothetical protein [Bacillota bacterium]